MRVLITNDDGIEAPGLRSLVEAFSCAGHDTYVCAPMFQRSGTSQCITAGKLLYAKRYYELFDSSVVAIACSGYPADCVNLALKRFLLEPVDVVVSGINLGFNLGYDSYFSGTVGSARAAAMLGIPAIAISTASTFPNYKFAAEIVLKTAPDYKEWSESSKLISINVPAAATGVVAAKLGKLCHTTKFELEGVDDDGNIFFNTSGHTADMVLEPGTDAAAVRAGLVSVVPVRLDCTDYDSL
jgi:5'-nucleotidase